MRAREKSRVGKVCERRAKRVGVRTMAIGIEQWRGARQRAKGGHESERGEAKRGEEAGLRLSSEQASSNERTAEGEQQQATAIGSERRRARIRVDRGRGPDPLFEPPQPVAGNNRRGADGREQRHSKETLVRCARACCVLYTLIKRLEFGSSDGEVGEFGQQPLAPLLLGFVVVLLLLFTIGQRRNGSLAVSSAPNAEKERRTKMRQTRVRTGP